MYNLPTVKVEREHTFITLIFGLFLVNDEGQIDSGKSDHELTNSAGEPQER